MRILAAEEAPSGHETVSLCGSSFCSINYQTLISSAIAIVLTIAFGLWVASKVRSDKPNKVQLVFELFLDYVRNLVGDTVTREGTDFIVPLAATVGFYILVANWLDFLPLTKPIEPWAMCRLVATLPAGDHTLVLGEVMNAGVEHADGHPLTQEEAGLTYPS